jgi:hypothetical protein
MQELEYITEEDEEHFQAWYATEEEYYLRMNDE